MLVPKRVITAFLALWLCTAVGFGVLGFNLKHTTHHLAVTTHHVVVTQVTAQKALKRSEANTKALERQEHTLLVAQLRSCHRLNVQRALANRNNYQDYKLYSLTARLLRGAERQPKDPRLSHEQQAAAERTVVGYTSQIEQDVRSKEWTPLTKCGPATYHPETYDTPVPESFSKLPSHRALYVGKGE